MDGLEPGTDYKLQLLFFEACCSRAFDVLVAGELVANDFAPWRIGGINGTGAAISVEFTAGEDPLVIELRGCESISRGASLGLAAAGVVVGSPAIFVSCRTSFSLPSTAIPSRCARAPIDSRPRRPCRRAATFMITRTT